MPAPQLKAEMHSSSTADLMRDYALTRFQQSRLLHRSQLYQLVGRFLLG